MLSDVQKAQSSMLTFINLWLKKKLIVELLKCNGLGSLTGIAVVAGIGCLAVGRLTKCSAEVTTSITISQ